MELQFPFKNITVNTLWDFRENDFLDYYFIKFKQQEDKFYKEIIEKKIDVFLNFLPDFENEILQIINTSNQNTISAYFEELKDNCSWIYVIDEKTLKEKIEKLNDERYEKFIKIIEKKSEEYFNEEARSKYKHLEEYVVARKAGSYLTDALLPEIIRPKTKINYNFYCINEIPELFDLKYLNDYISLLMGLTSKFENISNRYIEKFDQEEIIASEENFYDKAIVYVEGQHDIDLINKAAEVLEKESILKRIELRQRGGFRNLDKIWKFYNENSVEINREKKILLYDCDTIKGDEDFGYIFKRTIPTFKEHRISKGIENLFDNITAERAKKHKRDFIDNHVKYGVKRGEKYYEKYSEINGDEKSNFCKWICEVGDKEDFKNFIIIFNIIEEILAPAKEK